MPFHLQLVGLDKPEAETEDAAAFAARLARVVEALGRPVLPRFDLLCVTGAFSRATGLFPVPEERPIPCATTAGQAYAVECLERQLSQKPGDLYHHLSSDVGLIGRTETTSVVGDWFFRNIGAALPRVTRRCVAGGTIQLTEANATLPVYTIRLSRSSTNVAIRQAQLMGLISLVKERWEGGTLTPVILGDFGFDREHGSLWDMMCTDFDEITAAYGFGGTEHVWLGRESSFRGATGALGIEKVQRFHHLNDGGASLTCHPAVHVQANVRTFRPKRTFSASPRARSRGAPALTATEGGLCMAWSARQTGGQITLARTENGIAWDGPYPADAHTNVAPALTTFANRIILAWTEPDKTVWLSSAPQPGIAFEHKHRLAAATSNDAPALVVFRDKLLVFWSEREGGALTVSETTNASDWSPPRKLPFTSPHSPAAAVFRDRLYLAWTEQDETNSVSLVATPDGTSWNAPKTSFATHPRRHSTRGPALLAHADRMTLAWIGPREPNGYAWFSGMYMHLLDDYYRDYLHRFLQWTSTPNGFDWSLERTLDERSEHPPALATWQGNIHVAWTGIDADNLINVKVAEQPTI